MEKKRLSHDAYFMAMAVAAAARSTCPRRSVGAVLTLNNKIVSTGYNGAPRGHFHCLDHGCLMFKDGERERCIRVVHAELNALLQATGPADSLYCTDMPCLECYKACTNYGIKRIVFLNDYDDTRRDMYLNDHKDVQTITSMKFFKFESIVDPEEMIVINSIRGALL